VLNRYFAKLADGTIRRRRPKFATNGWAFFLASSTHPNQSLDTYIIYIKYIYIYRYIYLFLVICNMCIYI
jgi:hypothetical protein